MPDTTISYNPAAKGLTRTIEITIPSMDRYGKRISPRLRKRLLKEAKLFMSDRFGGATTYAAEGSYKMADGNLVTEIVNVISSKATDVALEKHLNDVFEMARKVAVEAVQESVAVTIDNVMDFIPGSIDEDRFVQPKNRWIIWLNNLLDAFKIDRPGSEPV